MASLSRLPALVACLATFLIARPLAVTLRHNEETAQAKDELVEPSMAFLEMGTHRHLQALMANMTVQAALANPPSMPVELQAFVSHQLSNADSFDNKAQAFLQAHTSKAKMLTGVAALSALKSMSADKSRVVLNKLALAQMRKIDIQRAECMTQQTKQKQLLEETGQDLSAFSAQGTSARAHVMETGTSIKRLEDSVSKLNNELSMHESKCKDETAVLRKQVELIKADTGTIADLAKMTCSSSSFLQTELQRCHKHHTGESFIAFGHSKLQQTASQLKSSSARQALQTALGEAFVQVSSQHRHRHRRERRHGRSHAHTRRHHMRRLHSHRGRKHLALLSETAETRSAIVTHKENTTALQPVLGARCTMRSNPDCDTVRDKLMFMQAGVIDNTDAHLAELASTEDDCKFAKANMQEQIKSAHQRLMEQQEMLAEATTIVIDAEEQSRLKGQQNDHLEAEYKKMIAFCQDSLTQSAGELCKIKSIRQELYKMEQKRPFIQDCEVSAWTPQECSKPCGGGLQNLVRQVVAPNDKGASCPPLGMQQSCNTQQCPIDCDMGEWSGWTSCSAKCGGGIMQRIRHIKRRGQHGGKLCAAEAESRGCGMAACDKDCDLAAWSPWTSCSKACGGGFQERVRRQQSGANGMGACPAEDSDQRLQYKRCNPDKCKPKGATLKCKSKVDVILLVDQSGSLGKKGWATMQKASSALINSFDPSGNGAQVAVLAYSGPQDMAAFKKCTGATPAGGEKVDMVKDCKMVWVSHLTTDVATVAGNIGRLEWQKGSTMTSQALASAEAELVYGRGDAESVVITLADRLPMMPGRTGQAAASLRKKARLIWAAATNPSDIGTFAQWASKPAADNTIYMNEIDDLSKPETLNRIIAAACSKVE